jgi:hypothetical protein
MIDPLVSLAFTLYSNPGVYALLLGSGVSRASGIPTGWEVVLDLVRKLAVLEGEPPEPTPEEWYRTKYGREPEYSDLLDRLTTSPTERCQILRPYFEPTEDERERGMKLPAKAHRAIADLMKGGFIRVVLTTNFDRLLEIALADLGIHPTVISSEDAVLGAVPLIHSHHVIVKVNGDYLDTRIKNTVDELKNYDPAMSALLDRIIDEFGLVVCGWSGEWDLGLRGAMDRAASRRFSMYWATVGELTKTAEELSERRRALIIRIEGADQFFSTLTEKFWR